MGGLGGLEQGHGWREFDGHNSFWQSGFRIATGTNLLQLSGIALHGSTYGHGLRVLQRGRHVLQKNGFVVLHGLLQRLVG